METTGDVIEFFSRLALSPTHRSLLAVCYDCCHQALQYEDPAESLRRLSAHGIRIGHVPVFLKAATECTTTRFLLEQILPLFPDPIPLEVETYTWTVLPEDLRCESVTDSISREIEWVERARRAAFSKD